MASTTFSGPVTSSDGFVGDIKLPTFTVATAPSAATSGAGTLIFVSNGAAEALFWLFLMAQTSSVPILVELLQLHR